MNSLLSTVGRYNDVWMKQDDDDIDENDEEYAPDDDDGTNYQDNRQQKFGEDDDGCVRNVLNDTAESRPSHNNNINNN